MRTLTQGPYSVAIKGVDCTQKRITLLNIREALFAKK